MLGGHDAPGSRKCRKRLKLKRRFKLCSQQVQASLHPSPMVRNMQAGLMTLRRFDSPLNPGRRRSLLYVRESVSESKRLQLLQGAWLRDEQQPDTACCEVAERRRVHALTAIKFPYVFTQAGGLWRGGPGERKTGQQGRHRQILWQVLRRSTTDERGKTEPRPEGTRLREHRTGVERCGGRPLI